MDLMALQAKLALDSTDYEKGITKAKGSINGLGNAIKNIGKISVAIFAAGAAAIGALTKSAVQAYAEYEQLEDGVKTLFKTHYNSLDEYADHAAKSMYKTGQKGEEIKKLQEELIANGYDLGKSGANGIYNYKTKKAFEDYAKKGGQMIVDGYNASQKAASVVMDNAWNAWSTAGMDANEYMATVTSFSASMVNSLGGDTAKAAELSDLAIQDMSDNANKMGTDMSMIQYAYAGFAKQNYTMLDNLKLGYGGTKTEMQRLLSDAEKLTGKKYDIRNFSDIVEAIHAIQTEMDITGTTAKEAEKTIEGSSRAMRASWRNLLITFAKGGDIRSAMQKFTTSAKNLIRNVMPVVGRTLSSIGEAIGEIAPVIISEIPNLLRDTLPSLITATKALIKSAIQSIPSLLDALWEAITGHGGVFSNLFSGASEAWEKAKGKLKDVIDSAKKWFNDTFKPEIESALSGGGINWTNLWNGLETSGLTGALSKVIEDAFTFLAGGGAAKIVGSIARLFNGVNASDLVSNTKTFANTLLTFIGSALSGIGKGATALIQAVGGLFNNLTSEEILGAAGEIGGTIITFLGQAIKGAFGTGTIIVKEIGNLFKNIKAADLLAKAGNFAETIGTFLVDAIKSIGAGAVDLVGAIGDLFVGVFNDMSSPETQEAAQTFGQKFISLITDAIGTIGDVGKQIVNKIGEKLTSINWYDAIEGIGTTIFQFITDLFSEDKGLAKIEWGDIGNTIGRLIGWAISTSTDAATGLAAAFTKWIISGQVFVTLGNIAKTIVKVLWNGVKGAVNEFFDNSIIVKKVLEWMEALDAAVFGKKYKVKFKPDLDWAPDASGGEKAESVNKMNKWVNQLWDDMLKGVAEGKSKDEMQAMLQKAMEEGGLTDIDMATLVEHGFISTNTEEGRNLVMDLIKKGLLPKDEIGTQTGWFDQLFEEAYGEKQIEEIAVGVETNFAIEDPEKSASDLQEQILAASGLNPDGTLKDPLEPIVEVYLDADTTMENAINTVEGGIETLKAMMNFGWSLPPLKVPHFSIAGAFNLQNGTVPTINVDWYRKAMQNGMILNSPTIFGAMGGKLLGAGEAGPEAVVGVGSLDQMIRKSVANAITGVLSRMDTLISGQGGNATVVLDSGELVGVMNRRLGEVQMWRGARRA